MSREISIAASPSSTSTAAESSRNASPKAVVRHAPSSILIFIFGEPLPRIPFEQELQPVFFTWALGLSHMRQKDLAQGLLQLFLQSGLFYIRQSPNGRIQEPTEFAVGEHATIDFGSKQGRIVDREFQYISGDHTNPFWDRRMAVPYKSIPSSSFVRQPTTKVSQCFLVAGVVLGKTSSCSRKILSGCEINSLEQFPQARFCSNCSPCSASSHSSSELSFASCAVDKVCCWKASPSDNKSRS